jgi:hypothetical protein
VARGNRDHHPPREWAVDVAVGAALLTVGAGGVLALLIAAGTADNPLWGELWWITAVAVSALLALLGLYMLAAVYFHWPLPETRASREARGQLEIEDITATIKEPGLAVVEVMLEVGRHDVNNASVNANVPDYVTIRAANESGDAVPGSGHVVHLADSAENCWTRSGLDLSASTRMPLHFRLTWEPPGESFSFDFNLRAALLHDGVQGSLTITPEDDPPGEGS